ncbi:MAG: malto-oligosyltrehalose trehalohydrolase [Acidobacteriales bacterium]|nr:malto-oligosyltrehalose trehalohydrolase [Terriglobales bacterium]
MMRGAQYLGDGRTSFAVWAPRRKHLDLCLQRAGKTLQLPMQGDATGLFCVEADAAPGDLYSYEIDDLAVPDPVSRALPKVVHGPTEIVDPAYPWTDLSWKGVSFREYVLYELHVGTFSPEGTFDGVIARLPYLKNLGVTAIELMPVSSFPGRWNWGYDGVSPYSVFAGYGGPAGLKRLVNAAHHIGLAIVLDVVYNHLGPEGNYLSLFGPYFTGKHQTPWGDAVNFDDEGAREVRSYFVQNALYWCREFHVDGLRLDAVQQIKDDSPRHIVAEITEAVKTFGRQAGREIAVIAETDENDARQLRSAAQGGWGLDAVWSDDFHHSLYSLLTGESRAYYADFGQLQHLERALREGFVYQGEHFSFWSKPRGTPPAGIELPSHVICVENHDQVGNRAQGDRMVETADENSRRLAAALLCLSPHTPMIFMGQEQDQLRRFMFFSDFGDEKLAEAVRKGRREEFPEFAAEDVPDPQSEQTFRESKLDWNLTVHQEEMIRWYRWLLQLRREFVTYSSRAIQVSREGAHLSIKVGDEPDTIRISVTVAGERGESRAKIFRFHIDQPRQPIRKAS